MTNVFFFFQSSMKGENARTISPTLLPPLKRLSTYISDGLNRQLGIESSKEPNSLVIKSTFLYPQPWFGPSSGSSAGRTSEGMGYRYMCTAESASRWCCCCAVKGQQMYIRKKGGIMAPGQAETAGNLNR